MSAKETTPHDEEEMPSEVQIAVPHVQQQHHWDCGLACTKMILQYLGISYDDFYDVAKKLNFGTSVWTIDLANIMAHYRVRHQFITITLGVDQGYSNKSFYKTNFTNDEKRINNLFNSPEELGISLKQGTISMCDIKEHLARGNPAVFLIDWNKIDCRWCNRSCLPNVNLKCLNSYQGHYVVVVGYDDEENTIYYKNPSFKRELCCCSKKTFENARKSYGTDEDVIYVYKETVHEANLTL